jgi:CheY-like chemotaxis protein
VIRASGDAASQGCGASREKRQEVNIPLSDSTARAVIMVVDDDPLISMTTAALLEEFGHDVLEANSGPQALGLLQGANSIDLLITDQSMPGMSGIELAQAARALRPALPVLLTSGYADLPEGVEIGLPCLNKPYQQDQLMAEIARLLERDD